MPLSYQSDRRRKKRKAQNSKIISIIKIIAKNVPSHRALAMFRGRNEGILQLSLNADPDAEEGSRQSHCEEIIRDYLDVRFTGQPADKWREQVIAWTWKIKVSLHLERN